MKNLNRISNTNQKDRKGYMEMTDWQRTPTICTDDYRRLTSYIVRLVRQQLQNILPNLLSSNLTISRTQKCNNADFGRTRKIARNN